MAQEILLYSPIFDFTAELFINQLEESNDEDVVVRMNTPGGDVFAGWGMIAKMREHGNVKIKVDGAAMSMGAYMLAFSNDVEALSTSRFLIHRAHSMFESFMSEEEIELLKSMNSDLKKVLKAKIDEKAFKDITGISLNDVFKMDEVRDVFLSAQEAKKIGLINKINKVDAKIAAQHEETFSIAASNLEKWQIKNQNKMSTEQESKSLDVKELANQIIAGVKDIFAKNEDDIDETVESKVVEAANELADEINAEYASKLSEAENNVSELGEQIETLKAEKQALENEVNELKASPIDPAAAKDPEPEVEPKAEKNEWDILAEQVNDKLSYLK